MDYRSIGAMLVVPAFLAGMLMGASYAISRQRAPITIRPDTRPLVPVVHIDGIRDGAVVGSMKGDVRVFIGEDQALAQSGGFFRVPAGKAFTVAAAGAPAGAKFVASKRGKKYYPVGSPAANQLSPANRVYFGSAEEARRAGFNP